MSLNELSQMALVSIYSERRGYELLLRALKTAVYPGETQ